MVTIKYILSHFWQSKQDINYDSDLFLKYRCVSNLWYYLKFITAEPPFVLLSEQKIHGI